MTPKSPEEIAIMRRGGKILARVLAHQAREAVPGRSLAELDLLAEKLLIKAGAKPAFKGYKDYPFSTCLSVNEEIVHGLPRPYRLKEGDILGIDIGLSLPDRKGSLCVDSALTVAVGKISKADQKLLRVTRKSLWAGIRLIKPGVPLGDIQAAIQEFVEKAGLTIIRDLCGHGIGRNLQESPQIPNFGSKGKGLILKEGMTFALEPMVSYRSAHTISKPDGWTVVTSGGDKAAHFEHTVVVTKDGVEVLTENSSEPP